MDEYKSKLYAKDSIIPNPLKDGWLGEKEANTNTNVIACKFVSF